jgi:hypothetical protein
LLLHDSRCRMSLHTEKSTVCDLFDSLFTELR